MSLLSFAAQNIESKAPFHCEKNIILTQSGEVRQSKTLANLIKKHQSGRASGSGITVYVLRLNSAVVDQFGNTVYLSYNDYTKKISLHKA